MKRGQISLFIIAGILLLIVLAVGIKVFSIKAISEPQENIDLYIQECLKYSGKKALEDLGSRGGDLYLGLPKLRMSNSKELTYLYQEGFEYLPEPDSFEQQLNSRTTSLFSNCISNNPDEVYTNNKIISTITENSVLFESGGLNSEVPVRLKNVHSAVQSIIESIEKSDMSTDTEVSGFIQPYLKVKPEFNLQFAYNTMDLPEGISAKYEIYDSVTTIWVIEDREYKFAFALRHMRKSI